MEPVVYIDMLFLFNFFMNSTIIFATSVFLQKKMRFGRYLSVSALSALYSSVMFFPQITFLFSAFFKLLFWLLTSLLLFPTKTPAKLLKNSLAYLSINLIFGGFMFLLIFATDFGTTMGTVISNGEIYLDISFATATISAILSYAVIYIISYIKKQNIHLRKITADVTISLGNKSISTTALYDTGCTLSDPFSGYPAIIISSHLAAILLDSQPLQTVCGDRYRILPFCTIDKNNGYLQGFIPDMVLIDGMPNENIVIGISNASLNEFSAILNYKIMETSVSGKAVNKPNEFKTPV